MAFLATVSDIAMSLPSNQNLEGYWLAHDGANFTDVADTPRVTLAPIAAVLSFSQLAARISATLGADLVFQPKVGGVNTGASLTVPAGQLSASGAVAFSATGPTVAGDLQTVKMALGASGTGPTDIRLTSAYEFASPFEEWSFFASGFSTSQNLGGSVGNALSFQPLGATRIQFGALGENASQFRWPDVPGTLQHFLAVRITNNPAFDPAQWRYKLRVNGATAIEVTEASGSANPGLALDTVTAVPVAADDLVCFSTESDGPFGATNQSRVLYAIGFLPD